MTRFGQSLATIILGCCVGVSAIAQDKAGFAFNAGLGISQIKDVDGTEKFEGNAFGLIFGAEYRFNDHFAIGANGFGLGTADDQFNSVNTEIQVKGLDIIARLIMPVSVGVELFALAGPATYFADLEPGGSNGFGDDAIEFGGGVDLGSSENFAFRVAGRYYDGPRDESGSLLTVGFNYRF